MMSGKFCFFCQGLVIFKGFVYNAVLRDSGVP